MGVSLSSISSKGDTLVDRDNLLKFIEALNSLHGGINLGSFSSLLEFHGNHVVHLHFNLFCF